MQFQVSQNLVEWYNSLLCLCTCTYLVFILLFGGFLNQLSNCLGLCKRVKFKILKIEANVSATLVWIKTKT